MERSSFMPLRHTLYLVQYELKLREPVIFKMYYYEAALWEVCAWKLT